MEEPFRLIESIMLFDYVAIAVLPSHFDRSASITRAQRRNLGLPYQPEAEIASLIDDCFNSEVRRAVFAYGYVGYVIRLRKLRWLRRQR